MKIKVSAKAKRKLAILKKKVSELWKDKKKRKIILILVAAVVVYFIFKSRSTTTTTTSSGTKDSTGSEAGTTAPVLPIINYTGNYAPGFIYGAHPDDWIPSITGSSKRWLISDLKTIPLNSDEELLYIIGGQNIRTTTPLANLPYQSNIDFIMEKWVVKKSTPALAFWWYANDNWGDRNGRRGLPKSEAAFIGVHFSKVS